MTVAATRARPAAGTGAALAMALMLGACASEPTRLAIGSSRNQTLAQLGAPTGAYALPAGGERLQYSRAPAGFEVSNVDLDINGRVVSIRQEMDERLFDRTIRVGVWREADVLRTYGKPFEVSRIASFDGTVWVWRFKTENAPRLLNIYLDPAGVVQRYHTSDELLVDVVPPG